MASKAKAGGCGIEPDEASKRTAMLQKPQCDTSAAV